MTAIRHPGLWISAALMAVLILLPHILDFSVSDGDLLQSPIDFEVYRAGGAAFLAGQNLYTQDYSVNGITLPFTYPPLAGLLFASLSLIPPGVGLVLLVVGSSVLLWWCLALLIRHAAPEWPRGAHRAAALVFLPVALATEPVVQTLEFAQINILLMGLVLIDTLARRPWLPRGVLVGLAAAIKLTPAVFGLYFLVKKDYRSAVVATLSGIGFTGLVWLISPQNSAQYWGSSQLRV